MLEVFFPSLMSYVYQLIPSTPTSIVCIVETWLSKISNIELFIPGFQLFRLDRDCHGGGVLIYVSDIFLVSVLSPPPPLALELLCLSVRISNFNFIYAYCIVPQVPPVVFLTTSVLIFSLLMWVVVLTLFF